MSTPPMYANLTALDREQHKKLRLKLDAPVLERVAELNSLFLATVEFADACKEFPIVFVRVGTPVEGQPQAVAPLAVLGLKPGSNLFLKDSKWTGNYLPAYARRYPFAMARISDDGQDMAMCFDAEWKGFSETEGSSLFADDGQPSEFLANAKSFVEQFEMESERTRMACVKLVELDLLQDMRFEAQLGNGEKIDVEGFLTVNEKKLAELEDAKVVELHRNGLLSLLEMHRLSLSNMSRLASQYQG
ncbi:SapC family protein [Roseateles sp. BYS180W]|uniref:SapC family protein n=1 Tax=Roseateles rivi TaxID=3299028 RepID=A0ABW7FYV6_9BURK